jgi:hypothetical protein
MPPNELVDHGAASRRRRHRRFFISMHQTAVALDIGGKDRRKASLDRRSLHC